MAGEIMKSGILPDPIGFCAETGDTTKSETKPEN